MSLVERAAVLPPFELCVFVNCPFDEDYLPLLHAMVFTIHDCGFIARCAVEDTGSNEMRIDKIIRLIRQSCYSIHDVSRVEISGPSDLPRFNMPFETGLAMGAIRFEAPMEGMPERDFLLLEAKQHRDKQTLSDLAGQDTSSHQNRPEKMVPAVRKFLAAKAKKQGLRTRSADIIWKRYEEFQGALPDLAVALEATLDEIESFDYLTDWIDAVTTWQAARL